MDLVLAIQAELESVNSKKLLSEMPEIQRQAALKLGVDAKNYVAVAEGRSVPVALSPDKENGNWIELR